jgi:hypothetical protein
VQQKVADGVFVFTPSRPHLLVSQLDKALLDVRRELLQPARGITNE